MVGARIHITGIVQGVGFRPFVYGLAARLGLNGWVRNTSAGVDIVVDGERNILDTFVRSLQDEAPPLSRIDGLSASFHAASGFRSFEIIHYEAVEGAFQPISPDVAICEDCLRELFDPSDRRYRYPFINCTNCGPRFTIIQDIPYDRPRTTMAAFAMCPECTREYTHPANRRFHAQPVAYPVCGPTVTFERLNVERLDGSEDAIIETRSALIKGEIVAIKGLGGFHLACDATNSNAVTELRNRKLRVDKPFALMMADRETVEIQCFVSEAERELLQSTARPIVLLKRRPESNIAREIAPGQDWIGVMLPYTPLHYLLFEKKEGFPEALVMTSGNLSEEPMRLTTTKRVKGCPSSPMHSSCMTVTFISAVTIQWQEYSKSTINRRHMLPVRAGRMHTCFRNKGRGVQVSSTINQFIRSVVPAVILHFPSNFPSMSHNSSRPVRN
jgi:hydrogenase maturation protein HypF